MKREMDAIISEINDLFVASCKEAGFKLQNKRWINL